MSAQSLSFTAVFFGVHAATKSTDEVQNWLQHWLDIMFVSILNFYHEMHSPSLGDDGVSSVWVECSKPLYNYIFWFELLRLNFNGETDEKLVL